MKVPWSEQIARNIFELHQKKRFWNADPNWPHTLHELITIYVENLRGVLKPYSTAEEKRGARLPTTCSAVCELRYGLFAGGKLHNRTEILLKVAR